MKNKPRRKSSTDCSFKRILWASIFILLPLAEAEELDNHLPFIATSQTTIFENALSSLSGISAINISAGDNNLQQNSAAIAVSNNGGFSASQITPSQINQLDDSVASTSTSQFLKGEILSGAFANGIGIVMLNQSSGSGNSQFNGDAMTGTFNLGVTYGLTENLAMVTSLGLGLTSDTSDFTFGVKFPYRF